MTRPSSSMSAAAFTDAYRTGRSTPEQVVRACLDAIRASDADDPPLRSTIRVLADSALAAAAESTARWQAGAPRSPVDGVPIVVKDNLDIAGVETTCGTRLPFPVPDRTAWAVERMQRAGAIPLAKANQHEFGAGTTGINPHHGTARNPHDPARWCGGSSSGSASAVAAGIVPIALASDAGGSIRSPSAFVGAVGLKPTFGRVSRVGMSMMCDTLDHIGPIASSCADAALCLRVIAGPNPDDDETWDQPPLPGHAEIARRLTGDVTRLRIGLCRRLLDGPRVEPAVAERIAATAEVLEEQGALLVDVDVPSLDRCRNIGLILLGAEGPSGLEGFLFEHIDQLGLDIQVLLRVGEHISARDYLQAQRVRNEIRHEWAELFRDVDAVLLPTTGGPAGVIRPDALVTGELDESVSAKAISWTFPSNLTGYPALSVPCGWVDDLPVGAQIVAPPWEEIRALNVGVAIEHAGLAAARRPRRFYGDALLPRV